MAVRCLAYIEHQKVVNESVRESFVRPVRRPSHLAIVFGSWRKVGKEGPAGVAQQRHSACILKLLSGRAKAKRLKKILREEFQPS
jgi:hypothetical protein